MKTILILRTHITAFQYVILIMLSILPGSIFCQSRFLLKPEEIPGFELISESKTHWAIGSNNQIIYGLSQQWKKTNIQVNNTININYFEFDNAADAFAGTSFNAGSYAGRYLYGSPIGEIIGDASWESDDGDAIIFQKWNIAIQIFSPFLSANEGEESLVSLSHKILSRIQDSISFEILIKDNEFKKHQIPLSEYNQLTNVCDDTLKNAGISEYKVENSKWVFQMDSIVMGIRNQWSNNTSGFCIDIAKFSNSLDAQNASKQRDSLIWNPSCLLNDSKSVTTAINSWLKDYPINIPIKHISVGSHFNNYSAHYYYYNDAGIDTTFFKNVLLSTNLGKTGVVDIEFADIRFYPNPTSDYFTIESSNGKTETYVIKLMDLDGRQVLHRNVELSGQYKVDVSMLRKAAYILLLERDKTRITKLIIIN